MGERSRIEDQIGGLFDPDRPARRRAARRASAPKPAEPERYLLTARPKPRIQADRASDAPPDRRVA
jgi:hypothetical protein